MLVKMYTDFFDGFEKLLKFWVGLRRMQNSIYVRRFVDYRPKLKKLFIWRVLIWSKKYKI